MFEYDQDIFSTSDNKKEHDMSPILTKSINKVIQNEGFVTYSLFVRNISMKGGNYLSLLKEVDIKDTTVGHNKEIHLFIKENLPDNERQLVSNKEIFLKEVFIYTDLVKLFNELQNEFDVPDEEKYKFVKYYDGNECLVILDNMTKKGFNICNRFEILPLKVMEMAIRHLAQFHGFSMVLKKYRPDFYSNKIKSIKFPLGNNDKVKSVLLTLSKISLDYLKEDTKKQVEMLLPEFIDKYLAYLHENGCKFKCLCHGDYRITNILVKQMNGEIAAVIPIDYQLCYYGSPVIDFFFMIFSSTDQKFRRNHMENLKEIYFESLTKFVKYFNIDVETFYTRQDFENDFKIQLDYGLIASLTILPLTLVSEEDAPDFNNEIKTIKLDDCFKTRVQEIVEDYIEWGYL